MSRKPSLERLLAQRHVLLQSSQQARLYLVPSKDHLQTLCGDTISFALLFVAKGRLSHGAVSCENTGRSLSGMRGWPRNARSVPRRFAFHPKPWPRSSPRSRTSLARKEGTGQATCTPSATQLAPVPVPIPSRSPMLPHRKQIRRTTDRTPSRTTRFTGTDASLPFTSVSPNVAFPTSEQ